MNNVRCLGKIRRVNSEISRFLEDVISSSPADKVRVLEKEYYLSEHIAIIMCLIDELQRQLGRDSGADKNVYETFQRTNRELLKVLEEFRGQHIPDPDRVSECIDEYRVIDGASIDTKRVEFYCKELLEE
jgi:hypothetical protein